jgi:hypothetical protein
VEIPVMVLILICVMSDVSYVPQEVLAVMIRMILTSKFVMALIMIVTQLLLMELMNLDSEMHVMVLILTSV